MEWIRLEENPKIKKLENILGRLKNFYPAEDSTKFKKYPYKWKSGENGVVSTRGYWCKSEVEVFADRMSKLFLSNNENRLVMFSGFPKEGNAYTSPKIRKNTLMYVINIKYAQGYSGQYVIIEGNDINNNSISLKYRINQLHSIVYKVMEDTSFFFSVLKDTPKPCYDCIRVTKDTTYKQYVKDCKKYNFIQSLSKKVFDRLSFKDYNRKDIEAFYFNKDGMFVSWNSDYKILNL